MLVSTYRLYLLNHFDVLTCIILHILNHHITYHFDVWKCISRNVYSVCVSFWYHCLVYSDSLTRLILSLLAISCVEQWNVCRLLAMPRNALHRCCDAWTVTLHCTIYKFTPYGALKRRAVGNACASNKGPRDEAGFTLWHSMRWIASRNSCARIIFSFVADLLFVIGFSRLSMPKMYALLPPVKVKISKHLESNQKESQEINIINLTSV